MQLTDNDRRRERRVAMKASLLLRRLGRTDPSESREITVENVSLGGLYFETDRPDGLVPNDQVLASVSIPETERREFPFARLAGRSRIVRVQELPSAPGAKRFGVALEFGRDATALTSIPTSG